MKFVIPSVLITGLIGQECGESRALFEASSKASVRVCAGGSITISGFLGLTGECEMTLELGDIRGTQQLVRDVRETLFKLNEATHRPSEQICNPTSGTDSLEGEISFDLQ